MKKITLLLMLLVSISMMYAQNGTMYLYTQGLSTDIPVTACSSNGQYFIGTFNGSCMFYNYKTGAVIQNVYDVTSIFYEFKAVSDSGVVVGAKGTSLDDMQPITFKDDSATLLSTANLPSFYYGTANGISADGTTIVGYIDYGGNIYKPVIWNNGTPSVLPYPTTDVFGEESNGAIAEHVSANGNMIVGRYYTSNYDEIGIKWVYNTQTSSYTATLFSSDINFDTSYPTTSSSYVTGNYIDFTTGKMSSNGQYLISTFVSRVDISTTHRFPILFDLNTNDTTMYVEYNDALGMSVSNSGLVTTAMPFLPTPHRNSYIYMPNDNTSGI